MGLREFFRWKPQAETLKQAGMEADHLRMKDDVVPESGVYKPHDAAVEAPIHPETEAVDRTAAEVVAAQMAGDEARADEILGNIEALDADDMAAEVGEEEQRDGTNG